MSCGSVCLRVGQVFSVERDDDAIAVRVFAAADFDVEVDGAHDAVPEVFVNRFFDCRPVDRERFNEAVDRRIISQLAETRPVWLALERPDRLLVEVE